MVLRRLECRASLSMVATLSAPEPDENLVTTEYDPETEGEKVQGGWFTYGCVIKTTVGDKNQGEWYAFKREQNTRKTSDERFGVNSWFSYGNHSANYDDVEVSVRHDGMAENIYLQLYANNPDFSSPSFGYRLKSKDSYTWLRFDVNDISYFDYTFDMADGSRKTTKFRVVRDSDCGQGDDKDRHVFLVYCNWTGPTNDQTISNWET